MLSIVITLVITIVFVILFVLYFMYQKGGVYHNHIAHCRNDTTFCGIKKFQYKIPENIKNSLLTIGNSEIPKRVNIYNWKAGKTVSTRQLLDTDPKIIEWYKSFGNKISKIVNEQVMITPLNLPTSCALLIYDEENDFINWHNDINYFDGRFFTVLLPITRVNTCTKYLYRDHNSDIKEIHQNEGNIIFEGSKVFHMASKLCKNESRMVLSLQYTTNDNINFINKCLMSIKDLTYIGI